METRSALFELFQIGYRSNCGLSEREIECGALRWKWPALDEGIDEQVVKDHNDEEDKQFDWESDFDMEAVMVKAGPGGIGYFYDGGRIGDDLSGPSFKGISHVILPR